MTVNQHTQKEGVKDRLIALINQFLQTNNFDQTSNALEEETDFLSSNPILPDVPLLRILEEWEESAREAQLLTRARDSPTVTSHEPKLTVELKPKELVQTLKGRHGNKSILCSKVFPFQYKRSLRTLITSGTDKTIRISSFDDLDEREDVDATIIQMDSAILDIDLCDGMLLAAAMNKTHHIIDVNAGVIIQSFSDHSRYVVNCLFGGKGAWFATGSHDTTVCLYKRVEGRYILAQTLQFLGAVESMCCIQGSTLVVGTRNDNHLHYFPITIKEDGLDVQHSAYNMNANGDAHCSFTPMHIVPCPRDENLLIFTDSESGRLVLKKAFSDATSPQTAFYGPIIDAYASPRCCWDESGDYIYAGSDDNTLLVISVASGKKIDTLVGHTGAIKSVCMVGDGVLVSAAIDGTVRIWK